MKKNNIVKAIIIVFSIFLFSSCTKFSRTQLTQGKSSENFLVNPFIEKDTVWENEIIIKGLAVIKEGAVLKIMPGTKVKFVKIDLNNDKIGDGELVIEGKIIAIGEPEKPIIFTSFEKNPAKKDWTFVYIDRNQDFIIENCVFSYAFTGLQIHYSKGEIKNNIFENNFEGLRYSTDKIFIHNNIFHNNTYGIRFESRRSEAEISYNEITENTYGIFSVMRSLIEENKIINNNIYNNHKYNFIMGMEQTDDISAPSNWWGKVDSAEINDLIYDKNDDPSIGEVKYRPFLETKVENAGKMKN
ncbi:right-handed parallel beta-helix repeat-containing protein [Candidatus Desantisbacteria bacterium]|nr:right-handed parallel beta-helix repeat-containing protein [Candidatus Desantisbacteria bacterium]